MLAHHSHVRILLCNIALFTALYLSEVDGEKIISFAEWCLGTELLFSVAFCILQFLEHVETVFINFLAVILQTAGVLLKLTGLRDTPAADMQKIKTFRSYDF
jgi:hypothetical protein